MKKIFMALLVGLLLISCSQEEKDPPFDLGVLPPYSSPIVTLTSFTGTYEMVTENGFLPEKHLYSFSDGTITAVPYSISPLMDEPAVTGSYTLDGDMITISFKGTGKNGSLLQKEDVGYDLSLDSGSFVLTLRKVSDDLIDTATYGKDAIPVGIWTKDGKTCNYFLEHNQCQVFDEDLNIILQVVYSIEGTGRNIIHFSNKSYDSSVNYSFVGDYLVMGNDWFQKLG